MKNDEAVKWLRDIRDNASARSYNDALSRGKALDYAIAVLERNVDGNKTTELKDYVFDTSKYTHLLWGGRKEIESGKLYVKEEHRPAAPGKATNHSEQVLDMVTPFDDRIAEFRLKQPILEKSHRDDENGYAEALSDVLPLFNDMQAHIRKQEADMLLFITHGAKNADALRLDCQRKNTLLLEAADEIESYVDHEYPKETRDNYPVTQRRYKRDIEIVHRIREEAK